MSAADPFSPEVRDPFYVPDRSTEYIWFTQAVPLGVMALVSLIVMPHRPINFGIIGGMVLYALAAAIKGAKARQHRLRRIQLVAELRRTVLNFGESEPPS